MVRGGARRPVTRERIVDTRPDGSVAITIPAESGIAYLMHGPTGPWHPWFDRPWWFWMVQFARMVARGVKPSAAYRYAQTMRTGGATRRHAIEIIAARDCGHLGTAIEIVDVSALPEDRTYREAWRRSSNGGLIWIDEEKSREIDEDRMWKAHENA